MVANTLSFMAAERIGDKIWCSNLNFNGLFAIDVHTWKAEYIGRFVGHETKSIGLHNIVRRCEDFLIFFSLYSGSIDTYNFSGDFSSCRLNTWLKKTHKKIYPGVAGIYQWGELIYVFPQFQGMSIIKYSPKHGTVVDETELKGDHRSVDKNERLAFHTIGLEGYVFIPIFGTNTVIKYDMENDTEEKLMLEGVKQITGTIDTDGVSIWICVDNSIMRFDSAMRKVLGTYPMIPCGKGFYARFVFHENMVYVLPDRLGAIEVIDMSQNRVWSVPVDTNGLQLWYGAISQWRHIENCICLEKEFMINPIGLKCALMVNFETLAVSRRRLKAPIDGIPDRIEYENRKSLLEDYINFVKGL